MAVVEGEVGRVVGHRMFACGNVHLDTAETNVLAHLHMVGQASQ